MQNNSIPALSPFIKIYPTDRRYNGEPQWIMHCPSSNNFFKIGWKEFEIIGRLHKNDSIEALQKSLINETGHDFPIEDIIEIITFIKTNKLDDGAADSFEKSPSQTIWKKVMHGYLYFTVPLLRPQNFLNKAYPLIRPLFGKYFVTFSFVLLFVGFLNTLPRADEFLNSFTAFFSIEGAIILAVSFMIIKVIHEFAHAFVATKYGVKVPHMGVAFIVLYPVLYTDTTDAWRLPDKNKRINIGMAGVYSEIILASLALIVWNYTEPGLLQMMLFSVVMISLVGSLLINLNPLMRFDGYYVLSDFWNIENLHSTAIETARHHLRRFFLGWNVPHRYDYPSSTIRKLIWFGYAIIVYRFFLFLGIAILVYNVFFPPLGLIAMILELTWFIGLPAWKELKIWWQKRSDIIKTRQGKITIVLFATLIVLCFVPIDSRIYAPAVLHADEYRAFYPSETSRIEDILISHNQIVKKDQILMNLTSHQLENDIALQETLLKNLERLRRREQTNIDLFRGRTSSIDDEIETARIALRNLKEKRDQLTVKAPYDGVINKIDTAIHEGRTVNRDDLLFLLISKNNAQAIHGYVPERDIDKISIGDEASFRKSHEFLSKIQGTVNAISPVNVDNLPHPSLASVYKGPIGVFTDQNALRPINPVYAVKIAPNSNNKNQTAKMVLPGRIIIHGEYQSMAHLILDSIVNLYRENVNIN